VDGGQPRAGSPARALLDLLRRREDEMAELLRALAAAESPSLDPAAQEPVLARLAAELEAAGMAVRRLRGRTSGGLLFAAPPRPDRPRRAQVPSSAPEASRPAGEQDPEPGRPRPRRPVQLLVGHTDTVWPRGTLASMPLARRDGRLYGPGVYDMKGGLVQAVFALRALAELGLAPPAAPVVLCDSDEETGSRDALRHLRRLARAACRVFVLEPSLGPAGLLKTRRKGVGHFTFTIHGRASHAGLDPEQGASAIVELAHLVLRLQALADPARGLTVNVGVVEGGLRGNVVAPAARAEVDVRVLRRADGEAFAAALRALQPVVAGTRLEVAGGFDRSPLEPTAGNRALLAAALAAAAELGLELGEGAAGGASDGNITSLLAPTLDGLGAVGGGAHAAHEHVELARMPERAALLALLLLSPVAGKGLAQDHPSDSGGLE
jgi:glutamate carboxypeptidase